ncbi:hypothetical protein A2W39_00815 [Candidatus Azambacteria bacterium RIFCSPHIGHO2_01_46_10]|uniref:GGDEF domain-containing protein n=3 Tax=Candidatus Azamiibacteriota TaxID=1752741 RepID=A0A1F5C985_9BACT|nr:MAG: hypothetical protein A2W60_01795 [Candidatus Azambacteria bacterium RIFCSPHIGHO2_02_46_12]OGD36082.1 MAG: hypothetical protein A2W39_00815 [Candidatus Azambacteria bacterium RIFCSPHIGHO2_01_46_10]OGD39413.1 MAG: hypothetical protein A3A25_00535 [Candidatus Azambacteria bacterium RIFCSPLOWO2_01_FULL_46_26]
MIYLEKLRKINMSNPEISKKSEELKMSASVEKIEKPEEENPEALKAKVRLLQGQLTEALNVIGYLENEVENYKEMAVNDKLTGLKNRRAFEEELMRVAKEIHFGRAYPERRQKFYIKDAALIFLDIDNFKKVNDTYGHLSGDKVLQEVAAILKQHTRDTDFTGRWGGEEMVVMLLGAGEKEGAQKAEELRNALMAKEILVKDSEILRVTASFGVAAFGEEISGDPEMWVEFADRALYEAKRTGKNRVYTFNQIMEEKLEQFH